MKAPLAALILGASLLAGPAFAHGGMVETSIHDQQKFAAAPTSVKVNFEHESAITSVTLMTAAKKQIAVDFKPTKDMGKEYTIPLPQLGKGAYILSYKSVSKDGHAMSGAVSFTVTGS
ncbi:MAG TPA: copper resistance CopC family protein [Caulobacterales bacterium]|nr:copper resistance CopC family protein [Caulobacterales bacterium]